MKYMIPLTAEEQVKADELFESAMENMDKKFYEDIGVFLQTSLENNKPLVVLFNNGTPSNIDCGIIFPDFLETRTQKFENRDIVLDINTKFGVEEEILRLKDQLKEYPGNKEAEKIIDEQITFTKERSKKDNISTLYIDEYISVEHIRLPQIIKDWIKKYYPQYESLDVVFDEQRNKDHFVSISSIFNKRMEESDKKMENDMKRKESIKTRRGQAMYEEIVNRLIKVNNKNFAELFISQSFLVPSKKNSNVVAVRLEQLDLTIFVKVSSMKQEDIVNSVQSWLDKNFASIFIKPVIR